MEGEIKDCRGIIGLSGHSRHWKIACNSLSIASQTLSGVHAKKEHDLSTIEILILLNMKLCSREAWRHVMMHG